MSDWIKRWFPWLGPVRADTSQRVLTDGSPVTEDHKELKPNGQQKDYVVLSEAERAKGYVRPVRRSYKHVGIPGPEHPLRDLTPAEIERWGSGCGKHLQVGKTGEFVWVDNPDERVGT